MPKRQATRKVETPEIMGEDSYIVYRSLTVEEQRQLANTGKEYQTAIDAHFDEYAKKIGKDVNDFTDEDKARASSTLENAEELLHYTDKIYASRIIDWNWVDDNDNVLPIPSKDWQVMQKLYSHEYEYIQELLVPKEQTEKK